MNIRIYTSHARFGFELAADLEAKSLGPVTVAVEPVGRYALDYHPRLSTHQVSGLLDALWPVVPEQVAQAPRLGDADVALWVGEDAPSAERTIQVVTDSAACTELWCARLGNLGLNPVPQPPQLLDEDVLQWSGVERWRVQVVRWFLLRQGVRPQVREDGSADGGFRLLVRDPTQAARPRRQRFAVEVACDDAQIGHRLLAELARRNFVCRPLLALPEGEAATGPIQLRPGPFSAERAPEDFTSLQAALHDTMNQLGIDVGRFPLRIDGSSSALAARVEAPLAACLGGAKPAYAGPYPERFRVTVVTDDPAGVAGVKARLEARGFPNVLVELQPSVLLASPEGRDFTTGFAIAWNDAGHEPLIASTLKQVVMEEMSAAGADVFTLKIVDSCSGGPENVRVYFPHQGVADGTLMAKLADPSPYRLRVTIQAVGHWSKFLDELRGWGWRVFDIETSTDDSSLVRHGGAPVELVEKVREAVRDRTGVDRQREKSWGDSDSDIYVTLPPDPSPAPVGSAPSSAAPADEDGAPVQEAVEPQLDFWAFGEAGGEPTPFLEVADDRLRVGSVVLPRRPGPRHQLAPHPSSFGHFCVDRLTALTLEHIATSVLLREPCLLEGETSTSKTSSILYLAALLNQPVVRVNLNGQTDTGEMVGRFVPQHRILELPLSFQELYAASDLLEAETRMILEKARAENRPLTRLEVQQIMAQEEMVSHPWRWEDGIVPQALKEGWWVLLDEVNLAEPQILERLNSVLEPDPTLVLTEYDNSVIGMGGTPVHADFRLFATMNPAEYAGRSVLSPAYRDRWRGYRFVTRPGEAEFLAMLRLLVFGEQPDFTANGRTYAGIDQEPRYHTLAALPDVDRYLEALARFHVALEHAVGQAVESTARIGSRRRERYVFTRRGLLSLLEYLCSPLHEANGAPTFAALRQALMRYYVGRLSNAEDRAMMIQLLDAHGIGPNTWSFAR
jgi:MoxR-like ATPase